MIEFIIGAIVGGIITVFAMCLIFATSEGDDQ